MTDDKTKQDTPVYETAWFPCSLSFLRCSHPSHEYTMTNSTEQFFSSLPPFFSYLLFISFPAFCLVFILLGEATTDLSRNKTRPTALYRLFLKRNYSASCF